VITDTRDEGLVELRTDGAGDSPADAHVGVGGQVAESGIGDLRDAVQFVIDGCAVGAVLEVERTGEGRTGVRGIDDAGEPVEVLIAGAAEDPVELDP